MKPPNQVADTESLWFQGDEAAATAGGGGEQQQDQGVG